MAEAQSASVVIFGPTHPYKGGIAQHTTRLALELQRAGSQVTVESWKAQYPTAFYPGEQRVPSDSPEIGVPDHVVERLAWYSPLSWWLAGLRHRQTNVVVLNIPTPFHAIPYWIVLLAMGHTPSRRGVVHNVRPHEPGPMDAPLLNLLLRKLDLVIVHDQIGLDDLTNHIVLRGKTLMLPLPSPWPEKNRKKNRNISRRKQDSVTRLLFLGNVRPYKGLDLLLHAIVKVPGVELLVAGEFWEEEERYRRLVQELDLGSRVSIRPGYVPESELRKTFSTVDALILPYRSGTGSFMAELGLSFGVPVIATGVGSIADSIEDNVTGLIIEAASESALVGALNVARNPQTIRRWRAGVAHWKSPQAAQWADYCSALLAPRKNSGSDTHG